MSAVACPTCPPADLAPGSYYDRWRAAAPEHLFDDDRAAVHRDLSQACGYVHPEDPTVVCQLPRHPAGVLHDASLRSAR